MLFRKIPINLCICSSISRNTNICQIRQSNIRLQQISTTNSTFVAKRATRTMPETTSLVPPPPTPQQLIHNINIDTNTTDLYNSIQNQLKCSDSDVVDILMENPELFKQTPKSIENNCNLLKMNKVKLKTIIDNSWILGLNVEIINEKLKIIKTSKPIGSDINDFIPLLKASKLQLSSMNKVALSEKSSIFKKHRLYYISERLEIKPYIVAQYLSKRLFMFTIPFDNLESILNTMLEYKVEPICILRDLWSFRYSPKVVKDRLERARLGQKDRLMPWMIRCTEQVLSRTIKNAEDEKALLGQETIVEYVANRLDYSTDVTRYILRKHESVFKVRVTKIKEILDYLLDEANFTPQHIAQNPRILCHSLETTKKRLDELKSHGCIPTSLVVVCRSANEYKKFLNTWIDVRKKLSKNDSDDGSSSDDSD